MRKIMFAEDAWEEYLYWQNQDKKTLRKINTLLQAIQRDPYGGEGKMESLRGRPVRDMSRRINEKDRLVYEMMEDTVVVKQCRGHYADR